MARKEDELNCTYFHVVFTLPQELNTFCLKYPKELYTILFQGSKDTLFAFGNDKKHLGAQMGAISILHTW
ncbi:MAG TPA: IS91 family transposase, partial [Crocinitomicaceae bacterium]|nr:IS91 family transposase [Crocinitomicaceae bacterium]